MNKLIFLIMFLISNLFAKNIFFLADRPLTKQDKKFIAYLLNKAYKKHWNVYVQKTKYNIVVFEKQSSLSRVKKFLSVIPNDKSIYKVISLLMEKKDLNPKDDVIIFSNMYFHIKNLPSLGNLDVNNETYILNDGFIASSWTPFSILFDKAKHIDNQLKDVNVFVLTHNKKPLFYMNKMRRFFYYFFKKLGANLVYYGNTGCDDNYFVAIPKRIKYFYLLKDNSVFKFEPLLNTETLQLINIKDKSIQNVGVDLHTRADIYDK